MKEVIKKRLENAPKHKDDEKTEMTKMTGLIQPMLTVIVEVSRVYVRKSNIFTTFVNTTSMESCFGILTFYIGFCHYQLHQYGTY